jgi:hypothetical protein
MSEPTKPSTARERAEERSEGQAENNREGARRVFSQAERAASEPLAKEERKRAKWATDLHTELESTYQMLGTVGMMASRGDELKLAASVNVINCAGPAADAWIDLAEKNPKVKDALQKFVSGTAAAQLISIHFAMLTPMLAAYGLVPKNFGEMILMQQSGMMNGSS